MSQAPLVLLTLAAATGGVLVLILVTLRVIWVRLRALPLATLDRRIDELADRQRMIEDKLSKLLEVSVLESESEGPSRRKREPGERLRGSKTSVRIDRAQPAGAVAGPTLIAIPNLSAPDTPSSDEAAVELADRFGGIWALADSGHTPEAVARTTGLPIGQVELILALRRQLATHSGDS